MTESLHNENLNHEGLLFNRNYFGREQIEYNFKKKKKNCALVIKFCAKSTI